MAYRVGRQRRENSNGTATVNPVQREEPVRPAWRMADCRPVYSQRETEQSRHLPAQQRTVRVLFPFTDGKGPESASPEG